MKIGFIGLGRMGAGMAANLIKKGHDATVYNRTAEKTRTLADLGAHVAGSIAACCGGAAVVTMLANDQAVEETTFGPDGLIANGAPGLIHISASTISVALAKRLGQAHEAASQKFIAAPVFGRPEAAAAGTLFVIAAGAPAALQAAAPIFDAIGQKTFVIGDKPEAANLVKLSGNFLIGAVIEALGEALALVGKGGIDRGAYLEMLTSTLFTAPVYKTYGKLIAEGKFEPAGFAAPLGLKDIRLALAAAEDLLVSMPLASLLRDRLLTLLANGGEHLDWSALGGLAAADAGERI